jgi:hypothetical protein
MPQQLSNKQTRNLKLNLSYFLLLRSLQFNHNSHNQWIPFRTWSPLTSQPFIILLLHSVTPILVIFVHSESRTMFVFFLSLRIKTTPLLTLPILITQLIIMILIGNLNSKKISKHGFDSLMLLIHFLMQNLCLLRSVSKWGL